LAEEVLDRIMQMADNTGATDEYRALNYATLRYPAICAKGSEFFSKECFARGAKSAALRVQVGIAAW
jgi:PatG C-terminal